MKQSFNLKTMFTLFLAAPFIVLIVMIFIFMGLFETRNTKDKLLEAPNYLFQPIKTIIDSEYKPDSNPPGVLMLMDNEGSVVYSSVGSLEDIGISDNADFFRLMMNSGPGNISIAHYIYDGASFFCYFDNSLFPVVYQKQIRMGISLFIVIISCMGLIFGQISTVIINSSIKRLIEASEQIAEGNLDEDIALKYDNELVHVAQAIDRMRLELKEKRNVEQRFFMSVTHDLKTPLTSINGYLEALADGIITEQDEINQTIQLMQSKSTLLDSRINELLEYSRSRTAGWRENWKEIDLAEWLKEISTMFRDDAGLYGRKYMDHINIREGLRLKGEEKLLSRALENLFDNACRYTESGDYIIFSATMKDKENSEFIEIVLEDSGSGISREDRDKIFELFYRNDRGRNSRGMGIGLASVQTIIQDHGGAISCDTSGAGGARFTISLEV